STAVSSVRKTYAPPSWLFRYSETAISDSLATVIEGWLRKINASLKVPGNLFSSSSTRGLNQGSGLTTGFGAGGAGFGGGAAGFGGPAPAEGAVAAGFAGAPGPSGGTLGSSLIQS